jgi:histidine phosphotransferase ChpT
VGQARDGSLPGHELTSKTAPAAMVQQLAASTGGGIQVHLEEGTLVMGAVLPVA